MLGIIFSIVAGVCMSLQGVFNTRLGEKIGLWETNVIVQGTAFLLTMVTLFLLGNGNFKNIKYCNKIYLLGGLLGVIITFTVMEGIATLGATYSIATILVAQLTAAALIDAFGVFGTHQVKFHITKIIGVCIMIIGIVVFKWKG
ncbi:DMT family transporter [Clostridium sp. P21]|uniref:DMT family transporter n=1 Tax=Clostridium muellerianum TaxID=2716538 RepID=A0A7Y0EEM8_9CLOT|nr:DMT family transporter [Clostridium muellerianum]NMM62111.1 DMT family transporter [Clostridium muellerianum]